MRAEIFAQCGIDVVASVVPLETQSSGGKSICQNLPEGLMNSTPTCVLPPCALPICTTRHSIDC